jgi:hypothetical protein
VNGIPLGAYSFPAAISREPQAPSTQVSFNGSVELRVLAANAVSERRQYRCAEAERRIAHNVCRTAFESSHSLVGGGRPENMNLSAGC